MTATAIAQDFTTRSWNGLLKVVAVVALMILLVAGAFALGRSSADDSAPTPAAVTHATAFAPQPSQPGECGQVHVAC